MTASSLLVPLAGLLTQPILAHALGVQGRGELAAAVAPSVLALGIATLGLPDALTYFLAKRPSSTRSALTIAASITIALGAVCLLITYAVLPFLSAGDSDLGEYILLAMAITIPALLVGVLRGAAMGRQMWLTVAVERALMSVLRVGVFVVLLVLGKLTVLNAVIATAGIPAICGLIYWRLLQRAPDGDDTADAPIGSVHRAIVGYGSRIWLGSVAGILLSRTDQILMVPLSSVEDLGIYTVANTITDIPFLVVTAIAGALIGVNSRSNRPEQIAQATRITTIIVAIGCLLLAAVLPFLIVPLFGAEFAIAVEPTLILLLAAFIYAPGFIASAGLGAQGRPGLRSFGICVAFATNVSIFVLVVPDYGVVGACWTNVATAVVFSAIAVVSTARVTFLRIADFFLVAQRDIVMISHLARRAFARVRRE